MDQPVLIVGTGAMGTLFAHRLAEQAPVIMFGSWPEALQAISTHGISLEVAGVESVRRVRVCSVPEDLPEIRLALVLVKSWQTEHAAKLLAQCLSEDGLALSMQNGLGNLEILQAELGAERAALAVTTLGSTCIAPGRARFGGEGEIHLLYDPRLDELTDLFRTAGLTIQFTEDLDGAIWGKLVINSAINPLTALIGCRNGHLLQIEEALWLLDQVAEETAHFATVQDIRLPFEDPVEIVHQVAMRSGENVSSMLADIKRGAPTEIDWINGAIALRATRMGYPTPLNTFLWKTIRARVGYRNRLDSHPAGDPPADLIQRS
jgi:2-dehydropantoate 2-reductase